MPNSETKLTRWFTQEHSLDASPETPSMLYWSPINGNQNPSLENNIWRMIISVACQPKSWWSITSNINIFGGNYHYMVKIDILNLQALAEQTFTKINVVLHQNIQNSEKHYQKKKKNQHSVQWNWEFWVISSSRIQRPQNQFGLFH